MQTVNVTPSDLAGGGSHRALSPEAQDIVDRLKDYYRGIGKASAAQNYGRHLRAFFAWSEGQGYSVHALPAGAVEDFLSSVSAAGQKETTVYVMRTQLKTILREAHAALGLDFAHLEYETGKPKAVREHQKAKERAKKAAVREENAEARANAVAAAAAAYAAVHTPEGYAPADPPMPEETYPMSDPRDPSPVGSVPATPQQTPSGSNTPTVVVMNAPSQPAAGRATVAQRSATAPATATPARGVLINNHVFTGPYIRISRIADGSDPLSLPGSENIVQTVSAAHVLAHGDIASYLQQWTLPSIALKSGVTTLNLVFHELNDKKQPTGRRDELAFNVPPGGFGGGAAQAPVASAPATGAAAAASAVQQPPSFDRATEYLLKKLDSDAEAARKKADELQEQLRKATDAQTTFMLTQQMQAAQDLKRELEERKEREMLRALAPPPQPVALPPVPTTGLAGLGFLDAPPKPDASTEMVKAMAEQQAKMMEVMAAAMRPPAPAPQKDVAEWLIPFIGQMNAQMMAQQQASQQMLLGIQQANQQFMQALITRENPVEKMLMQQLMEVKAAAAAPKGDEVEDFAEKLQKMQAVTQMLGGGGGSNFLADLLQNADSIGAGAAQIIAAARGAKADAPPTKAVQAQQQQLAAPPQSAGALPPAPVEPPKPTQGMLDAHSAFVAAVEAKDEKAIADGFVKLMVEVSTAPEPFVGMARRILGMFAEAEAPEDLYEVAKSLWTVVGKAPFRPAAKVAAKVFAKWYAPLHKAFFDVEKPLGDTEEGEDGDEEEGDETDGDEADEGAEGAEEVA